jgi:hypothetical protein
VSLTTAERTGVCGCCEGIRESTPSTIANPPGRSSLIYRVGTHATFRETMLVGISRHPALRALATREDDDPTIALVDAWAAALDVLTFYQERIADEGYLGTAAERRSIRELARAIGYELRPGVAAETLLAFHLDATMGAPGSTLLAAGTRVQSVPGQDEQPQMFETVEEIELRPEWNAIGARTRLPARAAKGSEVYLAGTDTGLRPGDMLAFIGKGRLGDSAADDWKARRVVAVEPNPDAGLTRVAWATKLVLPAGYDLGPEMTDVRVVAFRLRAALFGHNAPDWKAMPGTVQTAYTAAAGPGATTGEWPGLTLKKVGRGKAENPPSQIFLDTVYPTLVAGGYALLSAPGLEADLFDVTNVVEDARNDFTLSARTTRLQLSPDPVGDDVASGFNEHLRDTSVFAQSQELRLAEWPVTRPVWGSSIELDAPILAPPEGRALLITGLAAHVRLHPDLDPFDHWLDPDDGSFSIAPHEEDVFRVVTVTDAAAGNVRWHLDDGKGTLATIVAHPDAFAVVPPPDATEPLTESAEAGPGASDGELEGTLHLAASLKHVYDPNSLRIAANVARATHGEGRREILGGGDASVPYQRFRLKDGPLTHVRGTGATGAASTLEVRVNEILWRQVPALLESGPRDRVYVLRIGEDGRATLQFGDGTTGARLPSGAQNLRAAYRVGTGLAGQVEAGRLTMPMGAPLGVRGVTNPIAATGAADPETIDGARRNAPLPVLALGRIVSLQDVEDFAAAFAGIGKAQASRLWDGEAEVVHVTVAAADGSPPALDSSTLSDLRTAVGEAGDPHLRIRIEPFVALPFRVSAAVVVLPEYESAPVLDRVRASLADAFSFERRAFGRSVAQSEVVAAIQRVQGVEGVDLLALHPVGAKEELNHLLVARRARFQAGMPLPAELLTLAPDGVTVTAT